MPDFVLRSATPADAAAIAAIWHEGWIDGHLGNVPDALVQHRTARSFRTRASDRVGDTTVATHGASVAGFVMVVADEVEQLYVATAYRGAGVARLLLEDAGRLVATAGYDRAWLAVVAGNTRARRFYQRCGWSDDGPFDYAASVDGGAVMVPAHRYTRRLTPGG